MASQTRTQTVVASGVRAAVVYRRLADNFFSMVKLDLLLDRRRQVSLA